MQSVPKVISLGSEAATALTYDNHPISSVNDHVVRISTMTQPFQWHSHPNSDEAFLVVEGELEIEFENGTARLRPGDLLTVPKGVRHRTRPVGARSVNITFEAENAQNDFS